MAVKGRMLSVRLDHQEACLRFGEQALESDALRRQLTLLATQLQKVRREAKFLLSFVVFVPFSYRLLNILLCFFATFYSAFCYLSCVHAYSPPSLLLLLPTSSYPIPRPISSLATPCLGGADRGPSQSARRL